MKAKESVNAHVSRDREDKRDTSIHFSDTFFPSPTDFIYFIFFAIPLDFKPFFMRIRGDGESERSTL